MRSEWGKWGNFLRGIFGNSILFWVSLWDVDAQTIREGRDCMAIDFVGAKYRENEAFAYKMRAREECHVQNGRRYVRITIPDRASALSVSADMNARIRGEQ